MPKKAFFALPETKREEILHKIMQLYVAEPYEAITLQKMLYALEIPPVTFYRYFSDKDEVYCYSQQWIYEKLEATMLEEDQENYESLYYFNMDSEPLPKLESEFAKTIAGVPANTLLRVEMEVFKGNVFKKYKKILREERLKGNLRANVDEDLVAYMFATCAFNLNLFYQENEIYDDETRARLNQYLFQDFFLYGMLKKRPEDK